MNLKITTAILFAVWVASSLFAQDQDRQLFFANGKIMSNLALQRVEGNTVTVANGACYEHISFKGKEENDPKNEQIFNWPAYTLFSRSPQWKAMAGFPSEEVEAKKPPANSGKIVGEFLVGSVCGALGSLMLASIGSALIGPQDGEDPGMVGGIIGGGIGMTVGSSLGVYLIGNRGTETGSYQSALLGSAAGMLILVAASPDPDNAGFWIGAFILPSLGGVIGFNSTRQYRTPHTGGSAIINLENGAMRLAAPVICSRGSASGRRALTHNLDLIRFSF